MPHRPPADRPLAGGAHPAAAVCGLSSQQRDYQAEAVHRLRLPFPLLSDPTFTVADALALPTFCTPGLERLYRRLTLVLRDHAARP